MQIRNYLLQSLSLLLMTLASLAVPKLYGAEAFSLLALAQTTAAWSSSIVFLGAPSGLAVLAAKNRHRVQFGKQIALVHFTLILGVILIARTSGLFDDWHSAVALLSASYGLFFSVNGLSLGANEIIKYSSAQVMRSVLWLSALVILSKMNSDLAGQDLVVLLSASFLFVSVVVCRDLKWISVTPRYLTRYVKLTIRIGASGILAAVLGQLLLRADLYFIGYFLGARAVASYAILQMAGYLLIHSGSAVGQFYFPLGGTNPSRSDLGKLVRGCLSVLMINSLLGLMVFIAVNLFIFDYIDLRIENLETISGVYILGMLIVSSISPVANYLAGGGYGASYLSAHAGALAVSALLCIYLIPLLGVLGAAFSSFTSQTILAVLLFITARDRTFK
jgi:O-antigen/teichoic acid export membrane protein